MCVTRGILCPPKIMDEGDNQRRKSGLLKPESENACMIPQLDFRKICVNVGLKKRETNDLTLEKIHACPEGKLSRCNWHQSLQMFVEM